VLQGLRWWAQGSLSDQAAVELLARSFGGRLVRPGAAWVRPCRRPGWYWLDADALAEYAATQGSHEVRQVLGLAVRLINGDPSPRLRRAEPGRAAA